MGAWRRTACDREGQAGIATSPEQAGHRCGREGSSALFPEQWWGVVVFTAFGSTLGAATVAPEFQCPLPPEEARAVLDRITFPRGSVGHHRLQPAVKGAKKALAAACADDELFYEVLHSDEDFETRYWRLRDARCEQWGRTTCFDLLLRAGALGVGGRKYAPQIAYLNGSTGPKSGFKMIWGREITSENADWGEALHAACRGTAAAAQGFEC